MRGKIIDYNTENRKWVILNVKTNENYSFHIGEWLSSAKIEIGKEVIFETPKEAINIKIKRNLLIVLLRIIKINLNC